MGLIMKNIFVVVLVILAIFGAPIATIESLNALFGLNIEVTLGTWLASFWLSSLFGSSIVKAKMK